MKKTKIFKKRKSFDDNKQNNLSTERLVTPLVEIDQKQQQQQQQQQQQKQQQQQHLHKKSKMKKMKKSSMNNNNEPKQVRKNHSEINGSETNKEKNCNVGIEPEENPTKKNGEQSSKMTLLELAMSRPNPS